MKNLLLSTVLVSCLFYNTANDTELTKALAENKDKFDVRVFVNPAMESVRNLIRNKLDNVFHSSGHAND